MPKLYLILVILILAMAYPIYQKSMEIKANLQEWQQEVELINLK